MGFRSALRREAERNGVRGWVRNRSDGSVEAIVQGERHAVRVVIDWARRGPPAARVDELQESAPEAAFDSAYGHFEERPTA